MEDSLAVPKRIRGCIYWDSKLLGPYPREMEACLHRNLHVSVIAEIYSKQKLNTTTNPAVDERRRMKSVVSVQWNKKDWVLTCYNSNKPWKYPAKWKTTTPKDHMLYSCLHKGPDKANLQKQNRLVAPEGYSWAEMVTDR